MVANLGLEKEKEQLRRSAFIENAFTAFNDGKCIIGVFIDFSKAFDTIYHEILLRKLGQFNFNESTINNVSDYQSMWK